MSRGLRAALVLSCSYFAMGSVALAAEAAAPADAPAQPTAIGEVIVTAQFHAQKLQDTPLSITAMNAAALDSRGITDVANITNAAPNVTLKPLGSAFGPSLGASIRGIGQFDFNPALEPGVGIYVDDVYYPTLTGSDMDLLDLDRVEILRGPQGTLTGRNSIGGAIKMISKLPGNTFGGFIEGGYGSADREEFRGAVNIPITDQLALRISGTHKSQDGYVKVYDYGCMFPSSGVPATAPAGKCQTGLDGSINYDGLRASLRWRPTSKLDVVLTADYTKSDTTPSAEVLTYANLPAAAAPSTTTVNGLPLDSRFICGKFCNYRTNGQPAGVWAGPILAGYPLSASSGSDHIVFDGKGVSANIKYDINGDFNLQSITAYRAYTSSFGSDPDLSPTNTQYGLNRLTHHFTSEEVRLNGRLSDTFKFTIGGYYSDQKTTYFTLQDIRYAPIPLQFIGNDPVPASSAAGFATVFWNPIKPLNVTAGVRYTSETKDYTFVRTNFDGSFNPFLGSLNGQTGHYSGDHVDYRVSVDYRWSPALMTYATVSTGFKGGGVSPRPFNVLQVRSFNQEHLTAFEVGAKTDVFDGRLRFNASAFYNIYKDIQLTLLSCPQYGGPGPCALLANVGDADVKGLEFEANANLTKGWSINASASYIDFKYTRLDPATGLTKADVSPFTPQWKADFGTQYEFDLGKAGSITPRIDVSYQDSIYTNAANGPNNKIDAYTIANANITWRNAERDLQATLEVTNLTDKYYYLTKFDLSAVGAGAVDAQPARPREVVFTIKKSF